MYKVAFVLVWLTLLASSAVSLAVGPKDFPVLVNADIPGAPKLSKPMLVMGTTEPVKSEGMGWAAPALWDWDGDGKRDLLIGEFNSGAHLGLGIGSLMRVYKNVGSDTAPEFTDKFSYARYAEDQSPNGTPMSIYTWCCDGFTPEFVDLDNDGHKDLVTGQYFPGHVTWFRGSEKGFLAGVKLEQAGDPDARKGSIAVPGPGKKGKHMQVPDTDPKAFGYWNYSSASFGDFDGDGDYDMIIGGSKLRISENIGSKTKPKFGLRKQLLDTNGNALRIYEPTEEDKKSKHYNPNNAGDLTVPLVVDWDQDGFVDLLVTGSYMAKGRNAVTFFRGVKTDKGPRFEPGKALFKPKWGDKALPGSWIRVYVTDWNGDGVNDLLIGTSVVTVGDGEFEHNLSWKWESETGISKKNPGFLNADVTTAQIKNLIESAKKGPEEIYERVKNRYKYYLNGGDMSLTHKGYVYVMLGK